MLFRSNLETQCEKKRKEEEEKEEENRETKPGPSVKGKKKEEKRRRRRQRVLERAKGLTGFDYSLTVGPLNVCVFTKMPS